MSFLYQQGHALGAAIELMKAGKRPAISEGQLVQVARSEILGRPRRGAATRGSRACGLLGSVLPWSWIETVTVLATSSVVYLF